MGGKTREQGALASGKKRGPGGPGWFRVQCSYGGPGTLSRGGVVTLKRILWKEDMLATHGHKAGLRLMFCKCLLCPGRGLGGGQDLEATSVPGEGLGRSRVWVMGERVYSEGPW